ncbi:polyphosphate polymerase domain-containing protein [Pontiella sp.]|uniref:polyphosphate polymerase domain-containing protein n=1 Tax=Pontiella sp. TaxID=2837462 RepID=UPI003567C55B
MRELVPMAVPNPEWRYERKMLPSGVDPVWVEHRIRLHPAGFREVYPPREVNNLYLDTPGRADYHEHVQGVSVRSKTRIRWYGPLHGTIESASLELKKKHGAVGCKESYPVEAFALQHIADDEVRGALLGALPAPATLRTAVDMRCPSLVNRYARRYYLSADGLVRLTLDTNLQFYDPRNIAHPLNHPVRDARALVVELKYDPDHAEHAAAIVNRLPFRLARCSKYVEGVRRLLPGRP